MKTAIAAIVKSDIIATFLIQHTYIMDSNDQKVKDFTQYRTKKLR